MAESYQSGGPYCQRCQQVEEKHDNRATGTTAVALTYFARGVEGGGWAVPKKIYPGQGRLVCDGLWGRCEAEAKWVSAWSCALCTGCIRQMNYLPSGGLRRIPLAGGFVRKRFSKWKPIYAIKNKAEKDALIAAGVPLPELANLIGNYAYLNFIRLCEAPCEPGREYIAADELAEILGLDADQLCRLYDLALLTPEQVQGLMDGRSVSRGFVDTFGKNRAPMNEVMPMFKEIASHYLKGIRLDKRSN